MNNGARRFALRFLALAFGAGFFFFAVFFLDVLRVVISFSGLRIFAISFSRTLRRCAMLLAMACSSMRKAQPMRFAGFAQKIRQHIVAQASQTSQKAR